MNRKLYEKMLAGLAAALLLTGCGENDYPSEAEALPTFTTAQSPSIIYDTKGSEQYTTNLLPTAVTTESSQIFGTGNYPAATTVPADSTDTVVCETNTSVSTIGSETEKDNMPSLSDVPQVDISDYYKNTRTAKTVKKETTSPQPTLITSQTTTAPESVTSGTISVTTVAATEITDATEEPQTAIVNEQQTESIHEYLTDGRISPYTGREIISHPASYYSLSESDRKLYDTLVSALLRHESSVTFTDDDNVSFQRFFDMYQLIYNDEYRLYYISNQIEYYTDVATGLLKYVTLKYDYSASQVESMDSEIKSAADEILSQITPQMGDYEIVKLFHDSIVIGCTYVENDDMNTIYGCLVRHEALCQGYSRTMMYLCGEVGIECYGVFGEANGPHMWNIIEMDGEYYHVDATWDDPDSSEQPDSVNYDYFGLTDSRIRELRSVDEYTYDIPAATGTLYQYYTYNDLVAYSAQDAENILAREVPAAAAAGKSTVQFMCADDTAYAAVTKLFFSTDGRNIITILDEIKPLSTVPYNTQYVEHNSNSKTRVIKIYLKY